MELKLGAVIWIPCEVKPGPFSNERVVRVDMMEADSWVGFVDDRYLKDSIDFGRTHVLGKIIAVRDDTFEARLPGHSLAASSIFVGETRRAAAAG